MIIFPDQYGNQKEDTMSFTEAQHHEENSVYDWVLRKLMGVRGELMGVRGELMGVSRS